MSKATPADLTDAGIVADLFGQQTGAGWDGAAGYLQKVLDTVADEVKDRVGAASYDALAAGVTLTRVKIAEKYLALGELWRRRAQFLQAQSMQVRDNGFAPNLVAQALKAAEECEAKGWESLALVTGEGGTDAPRPGIGYVETGPFTAGATS